MKSIILTALSCFCITLLNGQPRADFNVVPLPNAITQVANVPDINLASIECICFGNYGTNNEAMKRNARFLAQYINEAIGEQLPQQIDVSRSIPHIELALNTKKITNPEGYAISVGKKVIRIEGATPQGVFYGIQVFRKALPVTEGKDVVIPAVQVSGQPRFAYRGMHLDVCRHFFGVDFVKEYIDIMALHGLNTLHWHISDDQGWRFDVEGYPRLIEVAAFREGSVIGRNTGLYDHQRHGGYFTREQIRDIIKYAAERYITIIPEVDMPGHMVAALTAYPELGCTGGPYEVWGMWGVHDDILCMGKDHTLQFVQDVLDEVMELFPSRYIHIGGDEAPRVRWEQCPLCQQRISDLGIHGTERQSAEALLQGWFTTRIQDYLSKHGRSIIGWDELLGCDIAPSATIMSWRGAEPGAEGAKLGHDVIMSPVGPLYFDYYQTSSTWNEPTAFGGCNTLKKVYDFEPIPTELPEAARRHIIGVQANLWTEYITCEPQIQYQVLPRMAALAEVQWLRPADKDYDDFLARLPHLVDIYKRYGWTYRAKSLTEKDE